MFRFRRTVFCVGGYQKPQQQQQQLSIRHNSVYVGIGGPTSYHGRDVGSYHTRRKRQRTYHSSCCVRHNNTQALMNPMRPTTEWNVDPYTGLVARKTTTKDSNDDDTNHNQYQVIVGLEIHAQLNVPTKLFSPALCTASSTGRLLQQQPSPNHSKYMHPYDVAVPGYLPVLSSPAAIQAAILIAATLNCQDIHTTSRFERKHYMYADLPHGYQITQQRWPIATNGIIEYPTIIQTTTSTNNLQKKKRDSNQQNKQGTSNRTFQCRINRIQLEQDTGKTATSTITRSISSVLQQVSRVDYNRAGIALVEIVTEPDIRSSQQASVCVQTIQQLLQHSRTSLGQMQLGQFRVDCNVNIVSTSPSSSLASAVSSFPRVEVKNLNSIQQVQDCIQYEANRQASILEELHESPIPICMETRTWNAATKQTELIRRKDGDDDYRFLPEPDLPPIVLNESILNGCSTVTEFVARHMPELPTAARKRLIREYGLSEYQAHVLVSSHVSAVEFLDETVSVAYPHVQRGNQCAYGNDMATQLPSKDLVTVATLATNLLCNELFALVKKHRYSTTVADGGTTVVSSLVPPTDVHDDDSDDYFSMENSMVSPKQLGEIVLLIRNGTISNTMAKNLLTILYTEYDRDSVSPSDVAKQRGLVLISDVATLRRLCQDVIDAHPEEMDVFRRGGRFENKIHKLFVGKVMTATQGAAHPERLQEVLLDCLNQSK